MPVHSNTIGIVLILGIIPLRPAAPADQGMYVSTDSNPAYGLNQFPTASHPESPPGPEQDKSGYELCEVAYTQPQEPLYEDVN